MSACVRAAWVLICVPCAGFAQMPAHDMSQMPGMDMPAPKPVKAVKQKPAAKVDHAAMQHDVAETPQTPPATDHGAMQRDLATPPADAMTHEGRAMPGADDAAPTMSGAMTMPGGPPPAHARDPDAYADGLPREPMHGMDMDDDARHVAVLVDRLETVHARDAHGQAIDAQGWYGGDVDKLWFKVDGERVDGRLGATRTEALWDHAIAPYWSVQTGVRQDFGDGPGRTWAAFGVQGLSPYWFDVQATAYVGEGGRTALRFESEYDLRLTQRLIVQPDLKMDVFGRDDARRSIGAGVSSVEAGLRLRYEVTRKIAPYAGVAWHRSLGNTARMVRDGGGAALKVEAVVGVRLWF